MADYLFIYSCYVTLYLIHFGSYSRELTCCLVGGIINL